MPTITIPSQDTRILTKPSEGEVFGSLWATRNIDLSSNRGKVRLAERVYRAFVDKTISAIADYSGTVAGTVKATSTAHGLAVGTTAQVTIYGTTNYNGTYTVTYIDANSFYFTHAWGASETGSWATIEIPVKFIRSNADTTDRWWALTQADANSVSDGLLFKTSGVYPTTGWAQDAIANSPTDCVDDMEIFGQASAYDRLVVARDTDLALMNNGAWTASWWVTTLAQAALTATNAHPLHQFLNLLLVADGNVVHTIDDSLVVVANRITLPKEYQIIWIEDDGPRVYFGTRHIRGGEALVFPWNGTDKTYDTPIPVEDPISFCGVAKDGVMHTVNGKGQLLGYNGQAFVQVAAFPSSNKRIRFWAIDTARANAINANGMAVIDGKINILADTRGSGSLSFEESPSGIWEYDEVHGLYCKYSIGQYDGTTDNEWGTFEPIKFGALTEGMAGSGKLLAGAEIYTDNRTTKLKAIFITKGMGTVTQRGYFITAEISSDSIRNFWTRLHLAFKKFENSTDRIVVKYRTSKNANFVSGDGTQKSFDIAWSSTTVFTSTSATLANAVAGDEIEIIIGKGAGATAHISTITYANPTYTVTLDEAIPSAAGNAVAKVQNWTKLGTISSQTIQRKLYRIAKMSPWIQFKIELRGTQQSPELEKLKISLLDADLT